MKENTVNISTNEYNGLRDFKSCIERSDTILIYNSYDGRKMIYTTKDNVTKGLLVDINNYKDDIGELRFEIRQLKNPQPKEKTLLDVKKMNVIQFIKWKFKK